MSIPFEVGSNFIIKLSSTPCSAAGSIIIAPSAMIKLRYAKLVPNLKDNKLVEITSKNPVNVSSIKSVVTIKVKSFILSGLNL